MYMQNNDSHVITYAAVMRRLRDDLTAKGYDVNHLGTIEFQEFISNLIPLKRRSCKSRFLDHFWLSEK